MSDDHSRLGSMARPGADSAGGMEDGAMTDIAKLLREAAEHTRSDDATRYGYELADRLDAAATELEGDAEPDYWVASDGIQIEFGMRKPGLEDDGANWCARTEVNDHINERMTDQPGLRLHLEPLYRRPPTDRAVPEGWQLVPVELTDKMMDAMYDIGIDEDDDDLQEIYKAMLAAAPGAGGGE